MNQSQWEKAKARDGDIARRWADMSRNLSRSMTSQIAETIDEFLEEHGEGFKSYDMVLAVYETALRIVEADLHRARQFGAWEIEERKKPL